MAWNYNGYGYNPVNAYAPQNAMPAQNAFQNQNTNGFMCKPVTSRVEAEVFQIPFDGSTTYFVDTANGKIYSKTFNFANGTAPLVTYVPETTAPIPRYATVDDLKALREELLGGMKHDDAE